MIPSIFTKSSVQLKKSSLKAQRCVSTLLFTAVLLIFCCVDFGTNIPFTNLAKKFNLGLIRATHFLMFPMFLHGLTGLGCFFNQKRFASPIAQTEGEYRR